MTCIKQIVRFGVRWLFWVVPMVAESLNPLTSPEAAATMSKHCITAVAILGFASFCTYSALVHQYWFWFTFPIAGLVLYLLVGMALHFLLKSEYGSGLY